MGLFDFGKKKQETQQVNLNLLPEQIAAANTLELKDIIAPSALKVTPKEMYLGDKIMRSF